MESKSKSQKTNANDADDRISSLSDEIIGHVLSFLPTKYAVATSILSKRWRYLWINITNLLFFDSSMSPFENERFDNFVDRVLHHCSSKQIQRFYLCTYSVKFDRVEAWINEAIRRNVYKLELGLSKFPSCVFTCKTLTVLKLQAYRRPEYDVPTSFYLPSLRILYIEGFYLSNNLTEKLFCSCPALEDLNVVAIDVEEDSNFIISAPVLKRLKFHSYAKIISNCKVVINAPNLEYMDVYSTQVADYEVENLSSIAEANVNVGDLFSIFDRVTIAKRALKLLRGLSVVKSLSLRHFTMTALDHAYKHHLPIFHNVIRLELTNVVLPCLLRDGRKILPCLLEVSPKLKVLILKMEHLYLGMINVEDASGAYDWWEPQSLPECLSSSLELVQIEGFRGNGYELKVVEYLLVHAAGLKKLTINSVRMAPETGVKVRQKLLEFPRISRSCQVYFLGDLLSRF